MRENHFLSFLGFGQFSESSCLFCNVDGLLFHSSTLMSLLLLLYFIKNVTFCLLIAWFAPASLGLLNKMPPAVKFLPIEGNSLDNFDLIGELTFSPRSLDSFGSSVTPLSGNKVSNSASEYSTDVYEPLRFTFVGYSVW